MPGSDNQADFRATRHEDDIWMPIAKIGEDICAAVQTAGGRVLLPVECR